MSMEKQGYIGQLRTKTIDELKELAERQNKLLLNVKFIEKLPDKGQKIKKFLGIIEAELNSRKEIENTSELFHQMVLNAEKTNMQRLSSIEQEGEESILQDLMNSNTEEKIIMHVDNATKSNPFSNSYEKVIKSKALENKDKRFYPHRSKKAENISDLSSKEHVVRKDIVILDENSCCDGDTKQLLNVQCKTSGNRRDEIVSSMGKLENIARTNVGRKSENPKLKHRYDESLEMSIYNPAKHHTEAKLISIEESIVLYTTQKKTQEMLQAQEAGKKLSQKMDVKMMQYKPKHHVWYRNDKSNISGESDDSEEEIDYPD